MFVVVGVGAAVRAIDGGGWQIREAKNTPSYNESIT